MSFDLKLSICHIEESDDNFIISFKGRNSKLITFLLLFNLTSALFILGAFVVLYYSKDNSTSAEWNFKIYHLIVIIVLALISIIVVIYYLFWNIQGKGMLSFGNTTLSIMKKVIPGRNHIKEYDLNKISSFGIYPFGLGFILPSLFFNIFNKITMLPFSQLFPGAIIFNYNGRFVKTGFRIGKNEAKIIINKLISRHPNILR